MRRSKNEMVKTTLGSYLKRRRYADTDVFRKSELVVSQSDMQLAVAASADKEATRVNSITYSSINNDVTLIDQQFTRLKTWVTEVKSEACRNELALLLCPVFCHLYIEMLRGGHRPAVLKYLKRHQGSFGSREPIRAVLEELPNVCCMNDIETNLNVRDFRSSKYHLQLSCKAMMLLHNYLSKHGHAVLLQVLQAWFDLEVSTVVRQEEEDVQEEGHAEENSAEKKSDPECSSMDVSDQDAEYRELEEVIRLSHESELPPTRLLSYSITTSEINAMCGLTSRAVDLLAAGFSDQIKLWSLQELKLYDPNECSSGHSVYEVDPYPHSDLTGSMNNSITLRGHSGPVVDLEFLHNGRCTELLLSVSRDATLRVWKLSDYSCVTINRGHSYPLWCVAANNLGTHIATGSVDHSARLWTLDRNYPLRVFAGHTLDVECVKFHPNGIYIATGSSDKTVRLWSVSDAKMVRVLTGHKGGVQSLAFSPNGKYLASAGEDKRVRVWDLAAGALLADLRGHTNIISGLSWSQDSEWLASGGSDGTVRLWNSKRLVNHSSCEMEMFRTGFTGLLSLETSSNNNLISVGVK